MLNPVAPGALLLTYILAVYIYIYTFLCTMFCIKRLYVVGALPVTCCMLIMGWCDSLFYAGVKMLVKYVVILLLDTEFKCVLPPT